MQNLQDLIVGTTVLIAFPCRDLFGGLISSEFPNQFSFSGRIDLARSVLLPAFASSVSSIRAQQLKTIELRCARVNIFYLRNSAQSTAVQQDWTLWTERKPLKMKI